MLGAAVLAAVGGVLLGPGLGVQRAVGAVGDVVDFEVVGVEEVLRGGLVCGGV